MCKQISKKYAQNLKRDYTKRFCCAIIKQKNKKYGENNWKESH